MASTAPAIRARKGDGSRLVMITAYDAPSARIADDAGVDVILVGDSVGMVVLGYEDTLSVTMEDMVHHTAAVARARPGALVVADMPWMSYHVSREETVRNAAALVRAGAGAVKLEGGRNRLPAISAILDVEIPVMGHLGLTPQSVHALGGYKVQAREFDAARALVDDARALADVGCFSIVLECVPDAVATMVTEAVPVPTIGIGAGASCDGQVLVYHDLLGLTHGRSAKFVRRYASLAEEATAAVARYAEDVRAGRYPSEAESYRFSEPVSPEAAGVPDGPEVAGAEGVPAVAVNGPYQAAERVTEPEQPPGEPRAGLLDLVYGLSKAFLGFGVGLFVVIVVLVMLNIGANRPADPSFADEATGTRVTAPAVTFEERRIMVGDRCLRVQVAATPEQRSLGLRNKETLGIFNGMLFEFEAMGVRFFTSLDLRIPLTVGFYDEAGNRVDAQDMQPCPQGSTDCPTVGSNQGPFKNALQVGLGQLPDGALGGSCPA